MAQMGHRPVLLAETLAALRVKPDGIYIDGTFGRGGHSREIMRSLGPRGRLLATDKDPRAIEAAREAFGDDPRFEILHASFVSLVEAVAERGWGGKVDGILLDLGVSSPQIDDPSRGFSFRTAGPLDMRMDTTAGVSAEQWIAEADEHEIAHVLDEFGEERFARRIARVIVQDRAREPLRTTRQLAELIAGAVPSRERHKDPATRAFQAIRIFINRELEELDSFLPSTVEMLSPHGRLAVISFHSLEDRRVKRFIRNEARGEEFPIELPIVPEGAAPRLRPLGKAIRASEAEVKANPRSRSAVLRVAERLP